jgi:hypothetical protein
MARDVLAAAREAGIGSTMAQPYWVKLTEGKGSVGVLLPHEVYALMARAQGGSVAEWVVGEEGRDTLMGRLVEEWCAHPDVAIDGEDRASVALFGMHADAVTWSTNIRAGIDRKVVICSWNVISSRDDAVKLKRQPCFVLMNSRLCECGCSGYCTYQKIFDVVSWSFQCLRDGVTPTTRHDGSAFTDHDRKVRLSGSQSIPQAGLAQVRGDWEWLTTVFRTRWYTAQSFCWMCDATRTPGPHYYAEFTRDAGHRATLMSHQDYLMRCRQERVQPSTLFKSPGLLLDHLVVDSMHAGDLGCFADAIGGLMWCEVTCKRWYRNMATGFICLNTQLKAY